MPTVEIPHNAYAGEPSSPHSQSPGLSEASPRTENNASPTSSANYLSPKSCAIIEGSAECVICLEALSDPESAPLCVLTKSSDRVCKHFFHMHCAQRIKSVDGKGYGEKVQTFYTDSVVKSCPNCRACFDGVREVPDPKLKPAEWLSLMDCTGTGHLGKEDLIDCLLATLPFEVNTLLEMVDQNWPIWDADGLGYITKDVAQAMMDVVKKNFPPFLPEDPTGWFDHWDVDGTGALSKQQVACAIASTLASEVNEAMDLLDGLWCLFDKADPDVITKAKFLEPRGLSDTLCASLAEDPRFKTRVKSALSPKSRNAHSFDPCAAPHADLEEGMRVRVMTVIGTPRYKWGRTRPGDIGTIKRIDREKNTCRIDFPKQRSWRGYLPELEKVPDYLVSYRPWQAGDEVQVLSDLQRAKKQQDDRSNWVSSMDATCGKVGKICLVLPAERKVKVRLERGTFVYVMENVVRPGMVDPPKLRVSMKVRVKAEVATPRFQWGNVSPGDVGTVTALHDPSLTCQVSFPRHHNWKGHQSELEVVADDTTEAPNSTTPGSPESSPPASPSASPRIRVGAYIRVKPSIKTPKFAWGRVSTGNIGVLTAVERTKELVTVDFPSQRNWIGYLHEMETVRVRHPTQQWGCPACTFLNEPDAVACDMCDGPPPLNETEAAAQGVQHNLSSSQILHDAAASNAVVSDASGSGPSTLSPSSIFHLAERGGNANVNGTPGGVVQASSSSSSSSSSSASLPAPIAVSSPSNGTVSSRRVRLPPPTREGGGGGGGASADPQGTVSNASPTAEGA